MSSFSRRCAAVALLVFVTAACASKQQSDVAGSQSPTSSSSPSGSVTPLTGAPSASGSPRAATSSPALPPPPKGAPSTPPAAGIYTYSQQGSASAGAFTLPADPEGTLVVEAPTATANGYRQTQTRRLGSNRSRVQVLLFTPASMQLEETTTTFGPQTIRCRTEHPLTLIKLPLSLGARWSDGGTCEAGTVTFTAQVLRKESRIVGGVTVPTFVVRHVFHVEGGDAQDVTIDSWVSLEYRLAVHAVEHATGTIQGAPFTEDTTEDLQSLTPQR